MELDSDSLVDLIIAEAANTSLITEEVLVAASCLGTEFVTSHIMAVVNYPNGDILKSLALLEEQELINMHHEKLRWSWTHDKFQKAAYLRLDRKQNREQYHLTVGRRLLSAMHEDELQEHIFIVAGQFGISLKLLDDDDEKETIAQLMSRAGARAAASSSFHAAASYFAMGTSLLKVDNWTSQYNLSLQLYNASAEMECCRGKFSESDKLVNVILRHTRCLEDRVQANEMKLYSLVARQRMTEAVCLGLDILNSLGEKLPIKPRLPRIIYEVFTAKLMVSKKSEEDILNLPPLCDWKKLAMLNVLKLVFPAVLRSAPELAPILTCRCLKMTLRHGICALSCVPLAMVGTCRVLTFCPRSSYR